MATDATKEPLKAYGPEGEIQALSYDGGKRWVASPKGKAKEAPMRAYTRRIAAIVPEEGPTPSWQRRIGNSFAPLADADILAGWAPLGTMLSMEPQSLDAIVIPFGAIPGNADDLGAIVAELRRVAGKIFVDIDAPIIADRTQLGVAQTLVQQADAVTVPNELVAMTLRKFNQNAFTVPPSINPGYWAGSKRAPSEKIRVAIQPTQDRFIMETLRWAMERWGDKAELVVDHWTDRDPREDPAFYAAVDILVVGAPPNRATLDNANLLPAMYSGCCIVAEGNYHRTILHGHSGILVPSKGPSGWRQAMTHVITDGRTRTKMQKGARERARLFTSRGLLARMALPYRVLIKEH